MAEGVSVELAELLALQRYVRAVNYKCPARAPHSGNYLSRLRGRGMDFAEARHYQAGDEIRHMEWRVTARTGQPHVKLYQEERERPVIILIDFSPSMYFGTRIAFKSVIAAQVAAMIAWTVVKQDDKIGALLYSATKHNEFTPRSRERGILPILSALSEYSKALDNINQTTADTVFNDALIRLRHVVRPGSFVVLISDFYQLNTETEKQLSRLRSCCDMIAYHVCDPIELHTPKPAVYAITDGQQELLLDTTTETMQDTYQQWCIKRQNLVKSAFKRLQVQCIQVTAELDVPRLIHQTYPRRVRE